MSQTNPRNLRIHPVLLAGIGLACLVGLLYFPLLFTNRVLASGDILLYFYPYRDYAAAVLRAGQLPLWNPYIFLGAPFLANPQAAVLYPLHWPLVWLPVTAQIYWSATIHTWLFGLGGYLLLRRWGASFWAAMTSALLLAGSGLYGGLIGHLNQMNAAAWLPWMVWWLASVDGPGADQPPRLGCHPLTRLVGLAGLVVLLVLAGHTQTAYISLFGLGIWSLWQAGTSWRQEPDRSARALWRHSQPLLVLMAGSILGGVVSAAQLLPTLELSSLGLRSGGLTYAEATSFSLKPLHLLWTLLPSYGLVELETVFATPAYSEYIAYVGVSGLLLAVVGAWQGEGAPRQFGLILAGLGLFLALGRWNPLYFVLYTVTPGFDLFRTPARWMLLYTVGMAVLAGLGMEVGLKRVWGFGRLKSETAISSISPFPSAALATLILLLLGTELWLAARALPHTHPTAPGAVDEVRTAPAHLLTDPVRTALAPAAMGRFLGMSTITYDPGDLADWRRILRETAPAQLDQAAFDQFIIALKVQELLVPNLALLWRVPTVDGFDGGVLPLQRYNEFLTLFIPPAELVGDGRLREQVRETPSTDLLNLVHGQYLITDKVRDLWFEDVFYDRQIGARLATGLDALTVETPHPFAATHVDLIAYVDGPAAELATLARQNSEVARLTVQGDDEQATFTLTAGGQPGANLADGALDSPTALSGGATVAYRDVDGQRQEYRVRFALPAPLTPHQITVERLPTPLAVVVQAVTLVDGRTGMFTPLLPSDRGRYRLVHSGDVKIYENLDLTPRATLVHDVLGVETPAAALVALQTGQVTAGASTVAEGLSSFRSAADEQDNATIVAYTAERVVIRTRTTEQALLVLRDTAFPGWAAAIDGQAAPIYTTDYLFRGVVAPPGEHEITFVYQPASWYWGLWVSAGGLLAGSLLLVVVWWRRVSHSSG